MNEKQKTGVEELIPQCPSFIIEIDNDTLEVYTKCIYERREMNAMLTAKVFQSGNSQAIRIPKEMQTNQKEFIIKKYGNCFYLIPPDDPLALLKQSLGQMDKDTPFEREQPMLTDLPDREGF